VDQGTTPIRRDLDRTRAELTDVVDAIRYKVNVPGRARDAISRRRPSFGGVRERLPDTHDMRSKVPGSVPESVPGGKPGAMSGLGVIALVVLGGTIAVLLRRRRKDRSGLSRLRAGASERAGRLRRR
jgi:hypothetical protein